MGSYTLGVRVAKYFEVRNAAGNLVIDDESSVIQVLARTGTLTMNQPVSMPVFSDDSYKPPCPYQQVINLNLVTEIKGHANGLKYEVNSAVQINAVSIVAYRIFGDITNPPYVFPTAGGWDDKRQNIIVNLGSYGTQNYTMQVVFLSLKPYNLPLPGTALVAYDSDGNIAFDAALGYVHHIASKSAVFNVAATGSFTVMVKDISGLGLDTSKLFLRILRVPAISQWQGSGNAYRVGYRSFIPRLRVTDNIIYVDFVCWIPLGYAGSIAQVYNPSYSFSVYYIPGIRSD